MTRRLNDGSVPFYRKIAENLRENRRKPQKTAENRWKTVEKRRRQRAMQRCWKKGIEWRVYGIALGYGHLNDHDALRSHRVWQTAVERDRPSASSPTLSRFENRAYRKVALDLHNVLIEQFFASHSEPPSGLILDFDATDVPVHENQEGHFFHGYCDHY